MTKKQHDDDGVKVLTWENIFITMVGGIGLLFATIFFNAFISSPPSRAEFNELKTRSEQAMITVDKRLERIENGQNEIINHLLER